MHMFYSFIYDDVSLYMEKNFYKDNYYLAFLLLSSNAKTYTLIV